MKKLIIFAMLCCLVLGGCSSAVTELPVGESPTVTPEEAEMPTSLYVTPANYPVSEKSVRGFTPDTYTIGNFTAGKEADMPITLHNGCDETTIFEIGFRMPSGTKDGRAIVPDSKEWLIVLEPFITLKPQEKREVVVTLSVPNGVSLPDKWECWVFVREANQSGMVQTEGCLRVFVNTSVQ